MKVRWFVLGVVAAVAFALPATVQAQVFFDDFDSYAAGSGIQGQGGWDTWGGSPAANAFVVDNQSYSAPNSLAVSGGADIVHSFSGITTGLWYAKVWTYVPSTQTGELFFIVLNKFDGGTCAGTDCNWSIQVAMCRTGCTTAGVNPGSVTNLGGSDVPGGGSTSLITNQWVEVIAEINLDANTYTVSYNGVPFDTQNYYLPGSGDQRIHTFDLFSNASSESYMDNVWLDTYSPVELQTFDIE
jgi:hypothetical protein